MTRRSHGPSRLRRAFGATNMNTPFLTLDLFHNDNTPWGTFTDADIIAIDIHRGGEDDYDVLPHTLSVEMLRIPDIITGLNVRLTLAGGQIRFWGRVGTMQSDDPDARAIPRTTFTATTWTVSLDRLNRQLGWDAGSTLGHLITQSMQLEEAGVPWHAGVSASELWNAHTVAPDDHTTHYTDVINKITKDSGVAVLGRLDGWFFATTPAQRARDAVAGLATSPALPRSAVNADGVEWTQPHEQYVRRQRITYTLASTGQLATVTSEWAEDVPAMGLEELDRTWWRAMPGDPLLDWVNVLAWRQSATRWRPPVITVDLLALMRSDMASRRDLARWLLTRNVGEALYLGPDWPDPFRSTVVFATAMDEQMTADRWELKLTLATYRAITGQQSPTVTGRTWETYPDAATWTNTNTEWEDA